MAEFVVRYAGFVIRTNQDIVCIEESNGHVALLSVGEAAVLADMITKAAKKAAKQAVG